MKVRKKLSNTSIYNTSNFDYKATYENLKTASNKNIQSLDMSEKGHITCWFKRPKIFVEISPKGKVNIYYGRYDDLNKGVMIIKKLLVCESFSIERDVPRTLKAVQEGIEANLADLIEPDLSQRLNYDKYIPQTALPKTSKALAEGIRNYLTNLTGILEHKSALEEMENTTGWIVTFGMVVTRKILRRAANYLEACDSLTEELTSALKQSPYGFRLCEEDRDGEGLSLRYAFIWRPADGPLELPLYPKYWEKLELAPFESIYPDSDFEDIYGNDDLD